MIYIKDGKAYYTKTGSETTCAKDHIMHSEYDYEFNPYSDIIKTYKPLGFPENVTVNGVKNEKDDNFVAEAVSDMNGTMYFSCFEDHMAVTNVKSIVGTYYDGNDAIVHFIRDDDTLWEYCIGKREFRKADIPPYQSSENSSYSPADLVKAIKYFLGVSGGEATDLNGDGTVNISDLIYLKSLLVS